jgi:hypothetical protein
MGLNYDHQTKLKTNRTEREHEWLIKLNKLVNYQDYK